MAEIDQHYQAEQAKGSGWVVANAPVLPVNPIGSRAPANGGYYACVYLYYILKSLVVCSTCRESYPEMKTLHEALAQFYSTVQDSEFVRAEKDQKKPQDAHSDDTDSLRSAMSSDRALPMLSWLRLSDAAGELTRMGKRSFGPWLSSLGYEKQPGQG
eukprot:g39265.t1